VTVAAAGTPGEPAERQMTTNRGTIADLILLTWLHRADRDVLQVHPRDEKSIPLTGVFATRSSHRPNPIGLHRVTVFEIAPPPTLRIQALEAIDGTPVLDLKAVMDESRDE
jgi:tRNA-Thr(GGU) m(6)t(6)A37 methyltransferase TsaA